jgi:hypothetical protein
VQIDRDMLMSGFIEPIPDLSPVIPSVEEIPSIDPEVSPYETNIISFYKTWDIFGAFSNFSPHSIHMPDENGDYFTWPTVEHYYQVCLLFILHVKFLVAMDSDSIITCQHVFHFFYNHVTSSFGLYIGS